MMHSADYLAACTASLRAVLYCIIHYHTLSYIIIIIIIISNTASM